MFFLKLWSKLLNWNFEIFSTITFSVEDSNLKPVLILPQTVKIITSFFSRLFSTNKSGYYVWAQIVTLILIFESWFFDPDICPYFDHSFITTRKGRKIWASDRSGRLNLLDVITPLTLMDFMETIGLDVLKKIFFCKRNIIGISFCKVS